MKSFTLLYVGWLAPLFGVRPGMPTTRIFSSPWPAEELLAVGLDFEEYVTQVWKLWINHRPYEDFVYSLINYIQLFEN